MDTETQDSRVFAAVLRLDGSVVLMVKRRSPRGPAAWQLPGGAVQSYETSKAVRRILREQTGLNGRVVRELFSMHGGRSTAYLVEIDSAAHPVLGSDPAVVDDDEMLIDWAWHTVSEIVDDPQIEKLKRALTKEQMG